MQPGENGEEERKNAANFPVLPGNAGKKHAPFQQISLISII
jgi:hypothetical protein